MLHFKDKYRQRFYSLPSVHAFRHGNVAKGVKKGRNKNVNFNARNTEGPIYKHRGSELNV